MFERHFGLRENPFTAGHQLRFLYPSAEHQEARAHLRYALENREAFLLITGEVGTGKTTALYDALAEWGDTVQVAMITNSSLTRAELLEEIALRFGVSLPPGATKPQTLVALERHLLTSHARGGHSVLMLDEAQNLATELLEEIRLLSNLEVQGEKLLQIFLVGQPELEAKLAQPQLRQLRQRIAVHYRLKPLTSEDTAGYIHHRLSVAGGNAHTLFPWDTCVAVHRLTHGIPREINTVASQAMISAFTENSSIVRASHVSGVERDVEFRSVIRDDGTIATPETRRPPAPVALPPEPEAPRFEAPHVTPDAEHRAPAWTPPPIETTPAHETIDPVHGEELDAWSAAARDLMAARRRSEGVIGESAPAAFSPPPPPPPTPIGREAAWAAPVADDSPLPPPPPPAAPPPTRRPAHEGAPLAPPPPPADFGGLPPRLREKLEQQDLPESTGNGLVNGLVAAAIVAALAIGAVLAQRFGAIDVPMLRGLAGKARAAAPAATDTTHAGGAAKPDSVEAKQPAVTVAKPPPSTARTTAAAVTPAPIRPAAVPAAKPAVTKATPSGATTRSASTAAAKRDSTLLFGVAVGSYLDQERAGEERSRLEGETAMPGRVIAYREAGTTMYRIVLGSFDSRARAQGSASELLSRGLVSEARVLLVERVPRAR